MAPNTGVASAAGRSMDPSMLHTGLSFCPVSGLSLTVLQGGGGTTATSSSSTCCL